MKNLILIGGFIALATAAHAQTSDRSSYSPSVHKTKSTTKSVAPDSKFAAAEMSYEEGTISFSNLPDDTKQPWAIVTDENGEVITQSRISNDRTMDVHKLSRGMYFVSLVCRNKTEKAFVLQVN